MTIIATFKIDEVPVAIGDLLISGVEDDREHGLPTIGNVTNVFEKGSGWIPIGLNQKINIISDECLIAWANLNLYARFAIKLLKQLANTKKLTYLDIDNFFIELSKQEPKLFTETQFIGWVVEKDEIINFSYPRIKTSLYVGSMGEVLMDGSSDKLPEALIYSQNIVKRMSAKNSLDANQKAVITSLITIAEFLHKERYDQKNLLEYFGGGWEIAFYDKDRFVKVEDITFIVWNAEICNGTINHLSPNLIIKQFYIQDILCIYSARGNNGNFSEISIHFVTPMYLQLNHSDKVQLIDKIYKGEIVVNLNSQYISHHVHFKTENIRGAYSHLSYRTGIDDEGTIFTGNLAKFNIVIGKDFENRILKRIREEVGEN